VILNLSVVLWVRPVQREMGERPGRPVQSGSMLAAAAGSTRLQASDGITSRSCPCTVISLLVIAMEDGESLGHCDSLCRKPYDCRPRIEI
jgi:hypothetical protein